MVEWLIYTFLYIFWKLFGFLDHFLKIQITNFSLENFKLVISIAIYVKQYKNVFLIDAKNLLDKFKYFNGCNKIKIPTNSLQLSVIALVIHVL